MEHFDDSIDTTTESWVFFASGCVLAISLMNETTIVWWVVVGTIIAVRMTSPSMKRLWFYGIIGCVLGFIRMGVEPIPESDEHKSSVEEGWVVSSVRQGTRAKVVLWHPNIDGYSAVYQERCIHLPQPGEKRQTIGRILPLENAPNPGGFDPFQAGLQMQVRWRFIGQIDCSKVTANESMTSKIRRVSRASIQNGDNQYGRRLLIGILLGDRFSLTKDALAAFGESGTGHLLAVSGLHVGACALCTFWLFNLLALRTRLRFPHRIGICASVLSVGFMLVISNAPLSAQRASLMIAGYLIGRSLGIQLPVMRCLSWATVMITLGDPMVVNSAAFQFSFIAVLSLVMYGGRGDGPMSWLRVAFVAWIFTAPIQVWHFGTVAPTGLIANLILTPLTAVYLVPLGLLGLMCSPITQLPMDCAAASAQMMVCIAESLVDTFGRMMIVGRWMTPLFLVPPLCVYARKRPWLLLVSCAALAWTALIMRPPREYVDFISVGQGDAVLLVSNGEAALVDAGPDPNAARIVSHLRYLGISRLEWVLITHQHPDHFNGLKTLIDHIEIGAVRHGPLIESSPEWTRLRERLAHSGISSRMVSSGNRRIGSMHTQTFAPIQSPHVSENDRSIALRLDGDQGSILLTGDLEHFGEARLAGLNPGDIDVLKVGHHGSKTSSSELLLKTVSPEFSVVSCGRFNRYEFPHREVVNRLKQAQIPILNTATHGLVRVILSPDFRVQAMRPPSGYGDDSTGEIVEGISGFGGSTKNVLSDLGGS